MGAMPMLTATLGSFSRISFFSQLSSSRDAFVAPSISSPFSNQFSFSKYGHKPTVVRRPWYRTARVSVSGDTQIEENYEGNTQTEEGPESNTQIEENHESNTQTEEGPESNTQIEENPESKIQEDPSALQDAIRLARRSADWEAAKAYKDNGFIYDGRIEGFNGGGILVRFYSLVGFLPFPQLSPLHSCKEPQLSIQDIAKGLVGSLISVKVIQAEEDKRKLIFSEKEAAWSRFSAQVKVGDIFDAIVGSVEDYGAFVHLLFPDSSYHLTGLVHISEVSWDLVHDIRDILTAGDKVRVKVISVDREKSRIRLSIKQLEEDPLLETLDKVIPQSGSDDLDSLSEGSSNDIEPLPGLETILEELLQEDGIDDAKISRQGFERRVVSQDLQLWLSNAPPTEQRFTLLARAGRQVQEIHLTTSLDQEGIKRALRKVLERVP